MDPSCLRVACRLFVWENSGLWAVYFWRIQVCGLFVCGEFRLVGCLFVEFSGLWAVCCGVFKFVWTIWGFEIGKTIFTSMIDW